jgi:hypothetical protein
MVNNITLNTYSITDLTLETMYDALKPVINSQILVQGIGALTELIIDILLQKDGKYIYCCTDRSRKAFKMILNHQGNLIENRDPGAYCIRRLLYQPLNKLIAPIAITDDRKEVQNVYSEIKNLVTDGSGMTNALALSLPSSCEGIPEELLTLINENDEKCKEVREEIIQIEETHNKKKELDEKKKAEQLYDSLYDSKKWKTSNGEWIYHHVDTGLISVLRDNILKIMGMHDGKDSFRKLNKEDKVKLKKMGLLQHAITIDSLVK